MVPMFPHISGNKVLLLLLITGRPLLILVSRWGDRDVSAHKELLSSSSPSQRFCYSSLNIICSCSIFVSCTTSKSIHGTDSLLLTRLCTSLPPPSPRLVLTPCSVHEFLSHLFPLMVFLHRQLQRWRLNGEWLVFTAHFILCRHSKV